MRHFKSALLIAVLLAVCQVATAQEGTKSAFDGKALADTIHAFVQELRENIARDIAIWRERSQKMRQELRDRFTNDEDSRRRLLTTDAIDATKDIAAQSWELILDAGSALKNVIDAKKVKIQEVFADVLGSDWAQYLPNLFASKNLTWESLGLFDYKSNVEDLLSLENLKDFKMPQNLGDLYAKLEAVTDAWCSEPEYIHPEKIPTTCQGPSVHLSYVPKSCVINSVDKTIVCDPAKLVMVQNPGECTLKHYTAFAWEGKQCRYEAEIGTEKEKVIGGGDYQVDLTDFIHDKIQDVVAHVKPDAPQTVTTTAVTDQPLQRIVVWTAPKKASLQTILKYTVTCTAEEGDYRTVKASHDARDVVIGSAAEGDNRALTAGAEYTCTVAAHNLMGTGPATAAESFDTTDT